MFTDIVSIEPCSRCSRVLDSEEEIRKGLCIYCLAARVIKVEETEDSYIYSLPES